MTINLKRNVFEEILKNITEAVVITDTEGIITWINGAFSNLTGYNEEYLIGKNSNILVSDMYGENFYDDLWRKTVKDGKYAGEMWLRTDFKKDKLVYLNTFNIKETNGDIIYTTIIKDMTQSKANEDKIHYLEYVDSLTGLYNRHYFMSKLKNEIHRAKLNDDRLAILYFDLDGFKRVNDTLGHSIGDKLLLSFSNKIKKYIKDIDTLARLGGDEFVVLLSQLKNDANIDKIAKRIISMFEDPFLVDNNKLFISASIGIAVFPDDGNSAEILIRNADIAMYRAKNNKNLIYKRYDQGMQQGIDEQFKLGNDLRGAISRKELELHYQPIIDIETNKIVSAEALLRWNHKNLGSISPNKFIPVAENIGLINKIGEWVLLKACKQNVKWQLQGYRPITICVNISVKQLEKIDFVSTVKNILVETGLHPKYLELEITESISMKNIKEIIEILSQLENLGIKLSIDDFGTGYSSLGQLKNLSISKLKIDRSFISEINEGNNNTAIISAIIAMANNLDLKIVAEGIETYEQLKFLKDNKCQLGQGYLFSKPVNKIKFEDLLKNNKE